MKFFDKKNFHESISGFVKFSSLFGFYFFPTQKGKKENIIFAYIKFIFFMIFGIYASIKSSELSEFDTGGTNSIIIKIAIKILMKVTLFMPTLFRINNFILRHKQRKIYRDIGMIDTRLINILGQNINFRKHFKLFFIVTVFYISFLYVTIIADNVLTFQFFADTKEVDIDPLTALLAFYSIFAYLSFQLNHIFLVYSIKMRYEAVANAAEEGKAEVSDIGKIYNKLNDILGAINTTYGINVIYFFGNYMVFTIFSFFIFITTVTADEIVPKIVAFSFLVSLYWMFYTFFGIFLISLSSVILSIDGKIRANVNKTMQKCEQFAYGNLLNLQFSHENSAISCGMFTVDLEYLFILMSCLFSYLIILIQFESS